MCRIACILLSFLMGFSAFCGEPNTTIIVKQLTDRSQLPEKTVKLKLQHYNLGDGEQATAVKELMADVCLEDASHTAFTLKTDFDKSGAARVNITGLDDLASLVTAKSACGVIVEGTRCFVLLDKANDNLFVKAKGKQTLLQEYEIVEEVNSQRHTVVVSTWKNGKLVADIFVVDGDDLLQQRQRKEEGDIRSDWWP